MESYDGRTWRQPVRRRTAATMIVLLAAISIASAGVDVALAANVQPGATTTAATNVTSTSATLNGVVAPNKSSTTYYFQYGTTTSPYSSQTPSQGPVNGNSGKSVSANVAALAPSTTYHFRIVATNSAGTTSGSDLTFKTAAAGPPSSPALTISSMPSSVRFGAATTIAGQLAGPNNAGVKITLDENPYPYTAGFKATALTTTTTAAGAYALAVRPTVNTRYEVTAKAKPPVTSSPTTVTVRVGVSLHVSRRTPTFGQLDTFSGTVTPAHNGRIAQIQRRTSTGSWVTVARTALVAGTPVNGIATSTFSKQLRPLTNGAYRVLVNPADGDHATGASSQIVVRVRVKVAMRLSTLTPAIGQLVRFYGTVTPAHNGKIAQIQRRTSTGSWVTVASTTLVASASVNGVRTSMFSKQIRIHRSGSYRVLVNPRDADHITGAGPTSTVTVH